MFTFTKVFSSFSVKDIASIKKFYSEVLGVTVNEHPEGLGLSMNNGPEVFIYLSATNKPADFTVLNFAIDDIEKTVDSLQAKGVTMEHYSSEHIKTNEKGIARSSVGPRAMAWFKDPSGNILSIIQEK